MAPTTKPTKDSSPSGTKTRNSRDLAGNEPASPVARRFSHSRQPTTPLNANIPTGPSQFRHSNGANAVPRAQPLVSRTDRGRTSQ